MSLEDITQMNVSECQREIDAEQDVNIMRALVGVKRTLHVMKRKKTTGKMEINMQEGLVRNVEGPYREHIA